MQKSVLGDQDPVTVCKVFAPFLQNNYQKSELNNSACNSIASVWLLSNTDLGIRVADH